MLLLLLRLGPDLYLCAASSSTESLLGRSLGTYMISIYFLRAGSENQMNICKFVLTLALDQACSAFVRLVRLLFAAPFSYKSEIPQVRCFQLPYSIYTATYLYVILKKIDVLGWRTKKGSQQSCAAAEPYGQDDIGVRFAN